MGTLVYMHYDRTLIEGGREKLVYMVSNMKKGTVSKLECHMGDITVWQCGLFQSIPVSYSNKLRIQRRPRRLLATPTVLGSPVTHEP